MSDEPDRRELAGGELVAVGPRPGDGVERRAAEWPADVVDACLWEVALAGGNVTRAHASYAQWCGSQDPVLPAPSRRTIQHWKDGPHRNRYHEISQARARDVEEHLAQRSLELAARQQETELEALRQIDARIGGLDAVEASLVLRNVSGAKKANVEGALGLRGRSAGMMQAKSLSQIAASLAALGVATVTDSSAEPVTDADVVD